MEEILGLDMEVLMVAVLVAFGPMLAGIGECEGPMISVPNGQLCFAYIRSWGLYRNAPNLYRGSYCVSVHSYQMRRIAGT